jgi:hypothetical protein
LQSFPLYPSPVKCYYCNRPSVANCGFVLGLPTRVSALPATPFTCHRPVCAQHASTVPPSRTILCVEHAGVTLNPPPPPLVTQQPSRLDEQLRLNHEQLREHLRINN